MLVGFKQINRQGKYKHRCLIEEDLLYIVGSLDRPRKPRRCLPWRKCAFQRGLPRTVLQIFPARRKWASTRIADMVKFLYRNPLREYRFPSKIRKSPSDANGADCFRIEWFCRGTTLLLALVFVVLRLGRSKGSPQSESSMRGSSFKWTSGPDRRNPPGQYRPCRCLASIEPIASA